AAGKGGCRADQGKSVAVLTMTIVADATLVVEFPLFHVFTCAPSRDSHRMRFSRIGCEWRRVVGGSMANGSGRHCPKVSGLMDCGVWFLGHGHGLAACWSRRRDRIRCPW